MPIVTGIQGPAKNSERVRLYLDDEFAFDLPLLEAAKLQCGQALSREEVQALNNESRMQGAFDRAVNYLSMRPRSSEEIRRHLVKSGIPDAVVTAVIQRLRQRGYVDDLAFARFWIENRDAFKPMSPRALGYELYQKGVDRDVYQSLLQEVDVDSAAYRAAKKQIWRCRGKARDEFRHKLAGMLRRRGFDHGTIQAAIQRLEAELDESERDYFANESEQ